jgi:glucose/arabinose dehydrogenase
VPVTGTERLGWDQSADSAADLQALSFLVFVDGAQRSLAGAACMTTSNASGFPCSAPRPALTTGQHTLQLAALRNTEDGVRQSELSAPLIVVKMASAVTASAAPDNGRTTGSARAGRDAAEPARTIVIADDLQAPSALAPTPDGRIFVAERDRIRLVDMGALREAPALVLTATPAPGDAGLLDLSAAPQFASNHHMWSSQVVEPDNGRVVRLSRYREAGGVLGESAVVAELPVGSLAGRTRVRVGPDERLYLAIGDLSRGASRDLTYEGAVLRLERDGTTPRDNPSHSPILSTGHGDVRALAWRIETPELWALEQRSDAVAIGTLPLVNSPAASRATIAEPRRFVVAAPPDLGALEFLPGATTAAVATSPAAEALYRLTWVDGRLATPHALFEHRFGAVREVAVASDGAIYVATADSRAPDASPRDLLVRVTLR